MWCPSTRLLGYIRGLKNEGCKFLPPRHGRGGFFMAWHSDYSIFESIKICKYKKLSMDNPIAFHIMIGVVR